MWDVSVDFPQGRTTLSTQCSRTHPLTRLHLRILSPASVQSPTDKGQYGIVPILEWVILYCWLIPFPLQACFLPTSWGLRGLFVPQIKLMLHTWVPFFLYSTKISPFPWPHHVCVRVCVFLNFGKLLCSMWCKDLFFSPTESPTFKIHMLI